MTPGAYAAYARVCDYREPYPSLEEPEDDEAVWEHDVNDNTSRHGGNCESATMPAKRVSTGQDMSKVAGGPLRGCPGAAAPGHISHKAAVSASNAEEQEPKGQSVGV